jgi:hypothetical protein
MHDEIRNPIAQRFNSLHWHDSKLLGLQVYREESDERIKMSLRLIEKQNVFKPINLIFFESTYIKMEIDLAWKSSCSDDISIADCSENSELLKELSDRNPYDSFEGYLHFHIVMIPPGGTIDILAKGFILEESVPVV